MDAALKTALCAVAMLLLNAAGASAQRGEYDPCGAVGDVTIVAVSNASCQDVAGPAAAIAGAPPDQATTLLRAAGWTPLRSAASDGAAAFDLVAVRGRSALRIRRRGLAPDLDGWMAGRELIFARQKLVAGGRAPRGAVVCTSAFLVTLRGHPGGLSAAHCGGVRRDRTTHRRNAALRRPPQAGIVLGRVQRNLARTRPLDALILPVPSGASRPSASVVSRGVSRPPWFVIGTARALGGRRVCYTGRTSGVDRCGVILSGSARAINRRASRISGTRVTCTSITAREGDSGGPVYTAPSAGGTVRAIGITTLVVGLFQTMCFTPIEPVLDALNARLVTAGAR
ncbi:MAG: S1 family peptidase [Actinobacteria bacterium]|nr:S1 family peptidase [Actinomycetota bacterium]